MESFYGIHCNLNLMLLIFLVFPPRTRDTAPSRSAIVAFPYFLSLRAFLDSVADYSGSFDKSLREVSTLNLLI